MGGFFSDYRVSPNFLLCWGWVVVEVGLGCDNTIQLNDIYLIVALIISDEIGINIESAPINSDQ